MTNPPSRNNKKLNLDEKIAILLAFSVIGFIITWGLTRSKNILDISLLTTEEPTETQVQPEPTIEAPEESEPIPLPEVAREEEQPIIKPPVVIIAPAPIPQIQTTPIVIPPVTPEVTTPPPQITPTPEVTPTLELTPIPKITIPTPQVTPEVTSTPEATPEVQVPFSDVTEDYWAYPFITALQSENLITSLEDNKFQGETLVTRAQYAVIITQAFNLTQKRQEIAFEDISENLTEKQAIENAVKGKFLSGYPENVFEPEQPISKMEVLLSLVSGLELKPTGDPQEILKVYQDWEEIPEYAREAIAAATEAGLVVNYPIAEQLNPNLEVSRGEVAAMVYQALVASKQQPPISSEYIVTQP